MTDAQPVNLTPEHRTIVAKLRYMARQYTNGSYARGGSPSGKHYLDEAADAIEELAQRAAVPVGEVKPVAWEGGEGWEALAWHLCAEEHGEDACNELIWEGGPVPEPWGDRWMKYEDEAKRLIALVHKYTTPPAPIEGWRWVPVEPTDGMLAAFADATSGAMVWDNATEDDRQSVRDGFTPGYRALIEAAPQPGDRHG